MTLATFPEKDTQQQVQNSHCLKETSHVEIDRMGKVLNIMHDLDSETSSFSLVVARLPPSNLMI